MGVAGERKNRYHKVVMKPSYDDLKDLRVLVTRLLRDEPVKIVVFGSRVKGLARAGSDVDIGILPLGSFSEQKLTALRVQLEESNIPHKVEIVNLGETSEAFRQEALREAVVWKA